MADISKEQVRQFRLRTHHLDRWYQKSDLQAVAGACGLQNSPPGTWEAALHNRIPDYTPQDMRLLLEEDKVLLQSWSLRGVPLVFPAEESGAFLRALIPERGEPWIYTQGIGLALDFLQMSFEELLPLLCQVVEGLDSKTIKSKTALDQTLAQWMLPLLPEDKRALWTEPSMYGSPDKQTVGGAAVSFLLRPCAFLGLVVFGRREGISPTFTSYRRWMGRGMEAAEPPARELVRKYLHCFGPACVGEFADWLGCSPGQAGRLWKTAAEEMEPVSFLGRERYVLSRDMPLMSDPPRPERTVHLLAGHDPYLDLRDRQVILEDGAKRRQVWQTVSNPGAVLCEGEVAGIWRPRKKGAALEVELTLWRAVGPLRGELEALVQRYAAFQSLKLNKLTISE